MIYPDVYGQGIIFALSALDGNTDDPDGLVAYTLGDCLGLRLCTTPAYDLVFDFDNSIKNIRIERLFNDHLIVTMTGHDSLLLTMKVVFYDAHTIIGNIPDGVSVSLFTHLRPQGEAQVVLHTETTGTHTVFALGHDPKEFTCASHRARMGLAEDSERIISSRSYVPDITRDLHFSGPLQEKTTLKAVSVLRANLLSGVPGKRGLWTTPDRFPHRHLWLWDTVFHALAYQAIAPGVAKAVLASLLEQIQGNGFLAHMHTDTWSSSHTQPPILAWGISQLTLADPDLGFLATTYPLVTSFVNWIEANRQSAHPGLYQWKIGEATDCRCAESGMDNALRFNQRKADHIDLSCYMVMEYESLAKIASLLHKYDDVSKWNKRHQLIVHAIDTHLFNDKLNVYQDRTSDGAFVDPLSVVSFLPLWAGVPNRIRAEALIRVLTDPNTFWTPHPLPTVARNDPDYQNDMWRGPTWINTNYMIAQGLRRYGKNDLALELMTRSTKAIEHWYQQTGCLFEFYDPDNLIIPSKLARKGPPPTFYDPTIKMETIRDYGWTAALYMMMVKEQSLILKSSESLGA